MHPIRYPRNFPTEILHKFSTPRLSLSRHHRAKNHRVPLRSLFEQISNGVYKTRLEQNEEKGKREGRERENKHGRGEREKKRKKKRDNDKKEPVNPFLERDNHRSDRASNLTGHPVAAARLPCLLSPINLLLPLPLPSSLSRVSTVRSACLRPWNGSQKNGSGGTIYPAKRVEPPRKTGTFLTDGWLNRP